MKLIEMLIFTLLFIACSSHETKLAQKEQNDSNFSTQLLMNEQQLKIEKEQALIKRMSKILDNENIDSLRFFLDTEVNPSLSGKYYSNENQIKQKYFNKILWKIGYLKFINSSITQTPEELFSLLSTGPLGPVQPYNLLDDRIFTRAEDIFYKSIQEQSLSKGFGNHNVYIKPIDGDIDLKLKFIYEMANYKYVKKYPTIDNFMVFNSLFPESDYGSCIDSLFLSTDKIKFESYLFDKIAEGGPIEKPRLGEKGSTVEFYWSQINKQQELCNLYLKKFPSGNKDKIFFINQELRFLNCLIDKNSTEIIVDYIDKFIDNKYQYHIIPFIYYLYQDSTKQPFAIKLMQKIIEQTFSSENSQLEAYSSNFDALANIMPTTSNILKKEIKSVRKLVAPLDIISLEFATRRNSYFNSVLNSSGFVVTNSKKTKHIIAAIVNKSSMLSGGQSDHWVGCTIYIIDVDNCILLFNRYFTSEQVRTVGLDYPESYLFPSLRKNIKALFSLPDTLRCMETDSWRSNMRFRSRGYYAW